MKNQASRYKFFQNFSFASNEKLVLFLLQPVDELRGAHAGHAFEDGNGFLLLSAQANDVRDLFHGGFEPAVVRGFLQFGEHCLQPVFLSGGRFPCGFGGERLPVSVAVGIADPRGQPAEQDGFEEGSHGCSYA